MVLALFAVISATTAPIKPVALDVAYIARYYYTDSRKSSYQLYVCALDGSHRKLINIATRPWNVQWVDRTHLAWIESTINGVKQLYISAAPFAQKRFLRESKKMEFSDSMHVNPTSRIRCDIGEKKYWLSAPANLAPYHPLSQVEWTVPEHMRKEGGKLFIDLRCNGKQVAFKWTNPQISYEVNYGANGMDTYTPDPEMVVLKEHLLDGDAKMSWVVGHDAITAHEGVSLVFALDWKKKTAQLLPLNSEELSIAPHRKLLVGSGDRLLSEGLWTSQLTVANIRTGKWRYIVNGRVDVGPVALRP